MRYIGHAKTIRTEEMTLGERVKALRKWRKLTQEELAERSQLSLGQISKIERGENTDPKLTTIERLVNGLCVSADKLITSEYDKGLTGILKNKMEDLDELSASDIETVVKIIDNFTLANNIRSAMVYENRDTISMTEYYEAKAFEEELEKRREVERYEDMKEAFESNKAAK